MGKGDTIYNIVLESKHSKLGYQVVLIFIQRLKYLKEWLNCSYLASCIFSQVYVTSYVVYILLNCSRIIQIKIEMTGFLCFALNKNVHPVRELKFPPSWQTDL